MTRHHTDGSVSYYHQMLGAAIVHPDFSEVIPLPPEFIHCQDGQTKNDCERNAARRWLTRFRVDHPQLPIIVIEDGLSSNAPHVRDLRDAGCHFILGAKDTDHAHLFEQICQRQDTQDYELIEEVEAGTRISRGYLFIESLSLNESNEDVKVNVLQCLETHPDGSVHPWTWVTDLELTALNVRELSRGARARWRIENETFNTLKNQGDHLEHNFGHGEKNLSVVLALLMLGAFLIDQVQQKRNPLFIAAWQKKGPKCALWEEMRHLFATFEVSSMCEVYEAIAHGFQRPSLKALIKRPPGKASPDDTS